MKALTIRSPWAQAIAFHLDGAPPKRIENRSWAPPAKLLGGELLVHMAASTSDAVVNAALDQIDELERKWWHIGVSPSGELLEHSHYAGRMVCRVRLVGLVRDGVPVWAMPGREAYVREQASSPWYFGPNGWVFDVLEVYEPGPKVRGALGLWDVPPDVVSALEPLRS